MIRKKLVYGHDVVGTLTHEWPHAGPMAYGWGESASK